MVPFIMMALSVYPRNIKLASPCYFRPRFPIAIFVACLHKTVFAVGRGLYTQLCFSHIVKSSPLNCSKRTAWSISSSGQDAPPAESRNDSTRLAKAVEAIQTKINSRIDELRKNLPVKVLFFLVGFYCASAFATVIGQTGDWDILAAGLAMATVEGIGAAMYRASVPVLDGMVTMFNYWKAGLSMGLFLDSFKYEADHYRIKICNPFGFVLDVCFYILVNIGR